jgi:hypothetical protein
MAVAGPGGTLTYTRDAQDRITGVSSHNAGGVNLTYGYNTAGQLSTVTDHRPTTPRLHQFTWTPSGVLGSAQSANGLKHHYTRDTQQRVTGLSIADAANNVIETFGHSDNAAGRRTTSVEGSGRSISYTPNNIHRITGGIANKLNGFPELTPYTTIFRGTVFIHLTWKRGDDDIRAQLLSPVGINTGTWHHHEVVGVMKNVDSDKHSFYHFCGASIYDALKGTPGLQKHQKITNTPMNLNRNNFINLTPQDLQEDGFEKVDQDDPDEYLSPFYQTLLGIWVYEWRNSKWQLRAIEMHTSELEQANPSERRKVTAFYGLDFSAEELAAISNSQLQFVANSGNIVNTLFMFFYIDGLLYGRSYDSEGNFESLLVCDVASERVDLSMPEEVTCIGDILVCKDKLDPVGLLSSLLQDIPSDKITARTGVFLPSENEQ